MKKIVLLPLVAALSLAAALSPNLAEAKSVKWSCVALDPNNPWTFTCTANTSRP